MPCSVIYPASGTAEQRTYCVLGAPRGGTTMVAEMLGDLGIFLGGTLNDRHEDEQFIVHRGIRAVFTDPARREERDAYLSHLQEVIAARNRNHPLWGWKDPIANFYIREIAADLRNLHFVIVTRDPGATAQHEMLVEPGWPNDHILNHLSGIAASHLDIFSIVGQLRRPALLISYERAMRHPKIASAQLLAFCGLRRKTSLAKSHHPVSRRAA